MIRMGEGTRRPRWFIKPTADGKGEKEKKKDEEN